MNLFDRLRRPRQGMHERPFGYAVVGLGHIAEYFLAALQSSPTCRVTAVVSGDRAKAKAVARKHGVPTACAYAEFEKLRDDPAVDAVYLALPVSLHREWTERAAALGKHVLCEKPMAPTAADAAAMIAACREAGVRLSIAYRCPHTAIHQKARRLVTSGALGPAESLRIESGFGFELKPGWRNESALGGGGSLWDVGVYPLNAARFLLGEEPVAAKDVRATFDGSGMERSIEWTSVFASGAEARCVSSYERHIPDTLQIAGAEGSLLLAPAFSHRARYRLRGEHCDGQRRVKVDERTPSDAASEFRLEAEELARAVQERRDTITGGEDGLADLRAMEAIYRAAEK